MAVRLQTRVKLDKLQRSSAGWTGNLVVEVDHILDDDLTWLLHVVQRFTLEVERGNPEFASGQDQAS